MTTHGAGGRNLVRIANTVVPRTLQDENPHEWHRLLQRAVQLEIRATCLCHGADNPLTMSIAKLGRNYALKRMPKSGSTHHLQCPSHGLDVGGSTPGQLHPALRQLSSGELDAALDVPLATHKGVRSSANGTRTTAGARTQKPSRGEISLLGFLHLLWERAGLNRWSPNDGDTSGGRKLGRVYTKLSEELQDLHIRRRSCMDLCFVPGGQFTPDAKIVNGEVLAERYMQLQAAAKPDDQPILLVIGEARSLFPSKFGHGLRLKGMPENQPIWIPTTNFEVLHRRWGYEVKDLLQRGLPSSQGGSQPSELKHFVIAGVQISDTGSLRWNYGSIMTVSADFIPVDSNHEDLVARALVRQNRAFTKPLRYDREEATHPDFVLTDSAPEVTMEVFGMNTPEYQARKKAKLAIYAQSGVRLWTWDACQGLPLPAFPPPRTMYSVVNPR